MRNHLAIFVTLAVILMASCNTDRPEPDSLYTIYAPQSMAVGDTATVSCFGRDTCFHTLLSSRDTAVVVRWMDNIDNVHYHSGRSRVIMILAKEPGVARLRLYNTGQKFDTTIYIKITGDGSNTYGHRANPDYSIQPSATPQYQREAGTASITVKGPHACKHEIIDKFLVNQKSNGISTSGGDTLTTIEFNLLYVGTARVRFYNGEVDTLVAINIKPTHNTYVEPELDFDDTRDSVIAKMGGNPHTGTSNTMVYSMSGYQVTVHLRSQRVAYYQVKMTASQQNLKDFVEERYRKDNSQYAGHDVYKRNTAYFDPGLEAAGTRVVIEDFAQERVFYVNPQDRSNWGECFQ